MREMLLGNNACFLWLRWSEARYSYCRVSTMWFALSLISARDQPGRRCRSPRGQSGRRRWYHSIARAGYRHRSITRSPGTAGIVADIRGTAPASVRTPTSLILRLAERELLRYSLSELFEFVIVEEADEWKRKSMGDLSQRDWTFNLGYRTLKFAVSSFSGSFDINVLISPYLFLLFKFIIINYYY